MRKLCGTLLICSTAFLFGDVMYERTSTMSGMMGMESASEMRVFIKDDRSRTEMTAQDPRAGTVSDVRIIRLDKDVIWSLDQENKTYQEYLIQDGPAAEVTDTAGLPMPEVTVTRTGATRSLLGHACEEVIVSMAVADEQGSISFKQTMWVSRDVPGYEEIQQFQARVAASPMGASSAVPGMDKASFEAFRQKISEIDGFPLEIEIDVQLAGEGMSFAMEAHSTVTRIETAPINDRVFEIPPSYSLQE